MSVPHITLEAVKAAIKDIVEENGDVGIQGLDSYAGGDCRYLMSKAVVEEQRRRGDVCLSKGKKPRTHVCAIGAWLYKNNIDVNRFEFHDVRSLLANGRITCPHNERGALMNLQNAHDACVGACGPDVGSARRKFRKLAGL